MMSDMDDVAVVEPLRLPKDATVIEAVSIDLEVGNAWSRCSLPPVCPVVVGVEDGVQPIPDDVEDGRRLARVDHGAGSGGRAAQQIGVVVLGAGDGVTSSWLKIAPAVHQVGKEGRAKRPACGETMPEG